MSLSFARLVGLEKVRWLHGGRDPAIGLDCIGLAMWAYREAGVDLSDCDEAYPEIAARSDLYRDQLVTAVQKRFGDVPLGEHRDGDVLILRAPRQPNHLGIVIGDRCYQMIQSGLLRQSLRRVMPYALRAFRLNQASVSKPSKSELPLASPR
jgi:cell wall-associated NlpC family hydrolase